MGRSIQDIANRPVRVIDVVAEHAPHAAATAYTLDQPANGRTMQERIPSTRFKVPVDADLPAITLAANVVANDYFRSLGFALKAGELVQRENKGCGIAWIDLQAAELFFGGLTHANRSEIVGVVDSPPLVRFQRSIEPAIQLPMQQDAPLRMTPILRASAEAVSDIRMRIEAGSGSGPALPIVRTLENLLQQTALAPLRIATVILGSAAVAGLMLSLLGLYATLRNAALQRKSELVLRIAVGAERRHIFGQILRDGFRSAMASTLGSAAVYQLFARIAPVDAGFWMWMAGPALLATAVVLASVLPARRAAMVDPLKVLRQDN